jgi:hypothetical protein
MGRLIQVLAFLMNKLRIAIKTGRIILLLSPESHLMFYAPPLEGKAWGADLPKSPVMLNPQCKGAQPIDVFIVPVGRWSDGSAAPVM